MYPYLVLFSEERRDREEPRFWFQDSLQWGWATDDGIDVRVLSGCP